MSWSPLRSSWLQTSWRIDSTDKLIECQFVGLGGDLVLDSADLRPPTSILLDRWSDSLKKTIKKNLADHEILTVRIKIFYLMDLSLTSW